VLSVCVCVGGGGEQDGRQGWLSCICPRHKIESCPVCVHQYAIRPQPLAEHWQCLRNTSGAWPASCVSLLKAGHICLVELPCLPVAVVWCVSGLLMRLLCLIPLVCKVRLRRTMHERHDEGVVLHATLVVRLLYLVWATPGLRNTQSPERGLSQFDFGRGSGSRCVCPLSVCVPASMHAVGCLGCSGVAALCQDAWGLLWMVQLLIDTSCCCVLHQQGTSDNITALYCCTRVASPLMEHSCSVST
jgi:hypothetical protein